MPISCQLDWQQSCTTSAWVRPRLLRLASVRKCVFVLPLMDFSPRLIVEHGCEMAVLRRSPRRVSERLTLKASRFFLLVEFLQSFCAIKRHTASEIWFCLAAPTPQIDWEMSAASLIVCFSGRIFPPQTAHLLLNHIYVQIYGDCSLFAPASRSPVRLCRPVIKILLSSADGLGRSHPM